MAAFMNFIFMVLIILVLFAIPDGQAINLKHVIGSVFIAAQGIIIALSRN